MPTSPTAFVTGACLPTSRGRLPARRATCRASASVETSASVSVQFEEGGSDGACVVSIAADCRAETSKFLAGLTGAVCEGGLSPTRINVLPFLETDVMTSRFAFPDAIPAAARGALQTRVEAVWAAVPPAPPAADAAPAPELVPYDVVERTPLTSAMLEAGTFLNVDPYAHADWTTVTTVSAAATDVSARVVGVFAEQGYNVVFCTVRSVARGDAAFATDVYYIQTQAGGPLVENQRNILHNALLALLDG